MPRASLRAMVQMVTPETMRLRVPAGLALPGVVFIAGLALATMSPAAPKPVPEPSPEERQLRLLVQPLRDGATEGAELQQLVDWILDRQAAGQGRDSERKLHRELDRIDQNLLTDLRHAAEWLRTLDHQRAELYSDLSTDRIALSRAIEEYHAFPPVPTEAELLPTHVELPDLAATATAGALSAPEGGMTGGPEPAAERADTAEPVEDNASELDASRVLNRITADLTALGYLLHACDNEYETEKKRHRRALALLDELFHAPAIVQRKSATSSH